MSLGYAGLAHKVAEDEHTVMYDYGGFNFNDPRYYNEKEVCDGLITISRECFLEPEIHERIRRMPSGRKKLVRKRVPVHVPYDEFLDEGKITIENCSNCWETATPNQIDTTALHLLFKILKDYQETGNIPEKEYYMV